MQRWYTKVVSSGDKTTNSGEKFLLYTTGGLCQRTKGWGMRFRPGRGWSSRQMFSTSRDALTHTYIDLCLRKDKTFERNCFIQKHTCFHAYIQYVVLVVTDLVIFIVVLERREIKDHYEVKREN